MSHERSTPSSPASEDFPSSTSTPTQQFASSPASGFGNHNVPLTALERFAMARGESSCQALAGATGGFMSGLVTCPLDVIKTKLQAQGGFRAQNGGQIPSASSVVYRGMLGTARMIWREEGLKGMYRGLGPIILGYLPTWAVWFTVYGKSKEYFSEHSVCLDNVNVVNFWSSIVAGSSSTMVTNPIWVIKTRLMSQVSRKNTSIEARPPWHYRSTLDAAKKMYMTEGILSFYSGLTPALLGLTHVAVQFPAYEYLKTKFTGQGMGQSAEGDDSSHFLGVLSASVLSKIMASSATYPHEVIRTRLQTQQRSMPSASAEFPSFRGGLEDPSHGPAAVIAKTKAALPRYKGLVTTFKTILHEEGWRAFYAGMGTNMMRAVPAATTTIFTYEFVMKHLNHAKAEGISKVANDGW
ncbi:Mitochondrial nicotinamide adenine dinucleotide transporter [Lachnellula hyalina]|uniref:Mitochondrial nicotinamide adenine dinucleotide transporter n=1 Tax=Lachnellula hyalina TaxID=1316788 RepID=A0A8H8R2U3_9HELO|nr:Mitochondrial nicotinamide adenine dinucleotide transporter [Lachnellula hyalina]TVY26705.1 Mitochondrial nicotinamide adenine dinucleotide transporter [Lachnellula hyalina]